MLLMAVVVGRAVAADTPLRVLSYNIHHGRGTDGVVNLERIAAVIRGSAADVVMLGLCFAPAGWIGCLRLVSWPPGRR
ncbi:MAG: hypothetical protein WCO99_11025, partial [Planctomycetota bacterium]